MHYTCCSTSPLPIPKRIQVLWDMTLCHWVSGFSVSKERSQRHAELELSATLLSAVHVLHCTEEALLCKTEIKNIKSNKPEAVSVSLWNGSVAKTLTLALIIRLSYFTTPFATSILQRLRKSWHPTTCCTAVSIAWENKPKLHKIIQLLLLCTCWVQTPKHFAVVEILHSGQGHLNIR